MMFGRLIGIWISQKISPAMYASVDMIICTIVISLMAIPAIAGNNLTYAVTAIYGLAQSCKSSQKPLVVSGFFSGKPLKH